MALRFPLRVCATASLLFAATSDALTVRQGAVYSVPTSERVSETQQFARDVDVVVDSTKPTPIRLAIEIPGLVYVTYVKNDTATTLGKVKVSGSSKEAVSIVSFKDSTEPVADLLYLNWEGAEGGANVPGPHSLLVEVELYKKNWLRGIVKRGDCDVVILDNVLYLPETKDEDGNDYESSFELASESGIVFISDPTSAYTTRTFELFQTALGEKNTGAFQVELAKLNKTTGGIQVDLDAQMNATFFVNELSALDVWYQNEAAETRNGLCVASQSDVNIETRILTGDIHSTKTAVLKAGSSCQKIPLPKREPAQFPERLDEPAVMYYLDNTPAPLPSGTPSTVGPVPASAAVPTTAPAPGKAPAPGAAPAPSSSAIALQATALTGFLVLLAAVIA